MRSDRHREGAGRGGPQRRGAGAREERDFDARMRAAAKRLRGAAKAGVAAAGAHRDAAAGRGRREDAEPAPALRWGASGGSVRDGAETPAAAERRLRRRRPLRAGPATAAQPLTTAGQPLTTTGQPHSPSRSAHLALTQLKDLRQSAARERLEEMRAGLGAAKGALEASWRRLDAFDAASDAALARAAQSAAAHGQDRLLAARRTRRELAQQRMRLSAAVGAAHRAVEAAQAQLRASERAVAEAGGRTDALEAAARALLAAGRVKRKQTALADRSQRLVSRRKPSR